MADILTALSVRTLIPDNTVFQTASIDKSDHVFQLGALYDTTPPAITDGNVGILRMDSSRRLITTISGVYAEDSAHVSGNDGVFVLSIRSDTLGIAGNIAGASGDYQALLTDEVGALYTKLVGNNAGTDVELSVTSGGLLQVDIVGGASGSEYAEDSVHTSGDVGTFILAVRNDAGTPLAADGDYTPLQTDATGRLRVDAEFTAAFDFAEDSPHVSTDRGAFVLAGTTGDYQAFQSDEKGALYTKLVGNFNGTDIEVSVNSSGAVETVEAPLTTTAVNDYDNFSGTNVGVGSTEIINSITPSGANNLFVRNIFVSSSGGPVKVIVQNDTTTSIEAVAFYTSANLHVNIPFPTPLYVPNGEVLSVRAMNNAGTSQNIYCTINGFEDL